MKCEKPEDYKEKHIDKKVNEYLKQKRINDTIEGGIKFDNDKLQWSLLPFEAIENLVDVYMFGMKKYGKDNWKGGFNYSRLFDACERHLFSFFWKKEERDKESNCLHLASAIWNLLTLLYFEIHKEQYKHFDDR